MKRNRLRLVFSMVGALLVAGGIVVAALSEAAATWISGPLIGVGAMTILIGLFPWLIRRDR
jgi:hypothetical protein